MVKAGDILQLEYTPDLTEAGIAYACQLLPNLIGNDLDFTYRELRQVILDKAVELAFRRYLADNGVEANSIASVNFSKRDPFYLYIGGRSCIFQSFWIDSPKIVQQVDVEPERLLQAGALLPSERIIGWIPGERDVYIFAYVTGQVVESQRYKIQSNTTEKMLSHWLTLLPKTWAKPYPPRTFGRLEFYNECSETLRVTIGGRLPELSPVSELLEIKPGEHVPSQHSYATLEYLYKDLRPVGRIRIYSPTQQCSYQVDYSAWRTVTLNGTAIYLGGYMSHPEYARRSRRLPSVNKIFPRYHRQGKARFLNVSELHPIRELLEVAQSGN